MATLRALLDALGPAVTVQATGDGLDREVSEVALVGPGDAVPDSPGALLVCIDPDTALSAGPCAGVVVKAAGRDWSATAVPVLVADPELPWHHLLQLLEMAVGSAPAGDLFALANSIAALVGGAVAIEDPRRRVLAYSSLPDQPIDEARRQGILGRQVPELSRNDRLYRQLQNAEGVIRVPADGDVLPRLAVAVRAGTELLGSIWVVEGSPLPAAADEALLHAGRSAALHLLRNRAGGELQRRARGEVLRGLLEGRTSPGSAGGRLGIDAGSPVAVLGFGLPPEAEQVTADTVAGLVQLQCAGVHGRSTVTDSLGTVYALVPAGRVDRGRLRALAETVVERARAALKVELAGAVGGTVRGLHDLPRSRNDVDAVLRLAVPGGVAAIEEVLPQVVLLELQAHLAGLPHLVLPGVERMLQHDKEQGTTYADSVLAYLAANAEVPAAAASVNVHPNTFRYRLRRVRELFDLDLEDPDVRLVTWLQLRSSR